MSSAELAILVLVGTGTIAGLVLLILMPGQPRHPVERAINDSLVSGQWAGGLDHISASPIDLPTHGGPDGGSVG